MPKASRIRHVAHHTSAKLKPSTEGASTTNDLPVPPTEPVQVPLTQKKKKEKQIEKREAFLQKLEPTTRTFSKSHERRMKRKTKERLAGDTLDDLQSALASLEKDDAEPPLVTIADSQDTGAEHKTRRPKAGTIGQGRSAPLSKNQRKRAFELERLRHPLILTNPEFAANPFQTIRTHAQNTLLKHEVPT